MKKILVMRGVVKSILSQFYDLLAHLLVFLKKSQRICPSWNCFFREAKILPQLNLFFLTYNTCTYNTKWSKLVISFFLWDFQFLLLKVWEWINNYWTVKVKPRVLFKMEQCSVGLPIWWFPHDFSVSPNRLA